MKKILLALFILSASTTFSQWQQVISMNPAQSLHEIEFYDSNTGYTVSTLYNGSTMNIYKTTNGGLNWTAQNSGYTGTRLMAIEILHPDTVYISGNYGIILKTTNGGLNWVRQPTADTTTQLWGLKFTNSFTGYCCGSGGVIYKTTNAGANWNLLNSGSNTQLYKPFFVNETTGYVSGAPVVLKTTNAGQSWFPLDVGVIPPLEFFRDIKFTSENTGYLIADIGRVRKTTNAGVNWTLLSTGTTEALFSISFPTPDTGYVGGDHGIVLKTTNAGDNWTIQQTSLNEFIYGIAFTSPVEGLACSWSGKILKTTNGGVVTSVSDPVTIPEGYSLRQNYPNPFNPSTDIEFSILKNEYVKLVVYDYLGREVKTLVSEQLSPGSYSVPFNGENLSSGVYYYKLTAGSFTETKKMTLLK
ncbi:MAG: T9SS type A sorting domain-containing protein [Ignavibacteriae bacterium]|nr:T9SS type A sorting domain-containing protein [Ignavibacteriota bacterium]